MSVLNEMEAAATASAGGGDESPAIMRIYIGGVSAGVTVSDIEKTFSSLGRVAGVELVRTNGRSFAYMDFQPSSQKSLAKLFSTYNGCTWKGGKLKLEKAKEHYLVRLKREWDEDIKLMSVTPVDPKVEPDAVKLKSESSNLEDTHLRIFFPKLRKVKSLPFKGSGKHKYSFQRVEVPSLPLHFCDCEEHSKQSEADIQKYLSSLSSGIYYEKELSVMESVMNKLFEKKNNEMAADRETELTLDEEVSEPSVEDISLEETDTSSDMDEDNIVTNIGKGIRGDKLMQLTRTHKLSNNQKSVLGKTQPSKDGMAQNKANSKKRQKMGLSDTSEVTANSKEHPVEQEEVTEDEFSAILRRNTSRKGHFQEPEASAEPAPDKSQTELSKSDTQSTKGHSWLQKSAWRDLVGQAGSSSFSISHVVPDISLVLQTQPNNSGIDTTVSSKKATETQSDREKSRSLQTTKQTLPRQAVSSCHAEMSEAGDQVEENQVGDGQKEPQRTSNQGPRRTIPKVVISDTCTFMRNAESEKEWAKARTALSGYLRKKKKREEKDGPKSFHHMPSCRN